MAKYLSNRQQNLNIGIVSYTEDKTVLEVTGKVGIGTTNATSKLHVVGDARITGVVTATTFVGALTGTASSTTTIPNLTGAITSNNTTTSLGSFTSDQLSTALSDKTGTGVAVFATSPTLVTPVLGAATATSIVVSSGSTFTNGPILVGTTTSTGTASQKLQVTGGAYVSGSVGIGTTNPTRTLDVNGDIRVRGGLYDVNNQSGTSGQLLVSTATGVDWQDATEITVIQNILNTTLTGIGISEEGVGIGTTFTRINFIGPGVTASANGTSVNVTVADYVSNAGIATSATQLVTPRTFQITGDVVASPISFDGTGNVSLAATIQPNSVGLGTDTTGDYVRDITGTANQITVTGGTGEGSTPILSIPSQFTAPQDVTVTRDLLVSRNLNVDGNITIGGTSALLDVQRLQVSDADLILGFRTDAFGNDASNDNTANHGGIAIASTEGNSLVQLVVAGIETLPPTYKKIMWFKSGTFAGLGTDAWLINYAVGIGSTQFPTGTRLAAGNIQFTQNDLAVVRNINSSGIVTATTFIGALTGTATSTTNIPNLTGAITSNNTTTSLGSFSSANLATALTDETGSGSAVFATSPTLVTPVLGAATATSINVSGIATINQLDVNQLSPDGSNYGTSLYVPVANGSGGWNWGTVASAGAGNLNGIDIREEGTIVGTAGSTTSIDFRGNNIIATGTAGGAIATVRVSDTPTFDSLVVSSGSTFTNGPILVGTATATGTASQPLQVTGGAYVSGNLGIGTTNPTSKLQVSGDVSVSGVVTATTFVGALTGTATSTTNIPNLTGDITSVNSVTSIAAGVIVDADINASAGIVDTKLATISTAGKVSNSATTATNANTNNAIVARDASGNFSAGTITANLTGTATSTTNIPNLTGAITSVNTTTSLGSFTSSQLATALTDETGSGSAVFATSPTLVTPVLGAASATSINSSGIVTATQFVTGASGSAIGINTNTISGPATITIDPAAVGDNTGLVVIKGDLQIDGTTTTINSTTVTVDDKNIILGSGAINDAAADGSGITIESGNGNKTFQFEDTGDNLGSSENLNVASGKVYKVNNTSVLSATTLGSGVVNSSLTSVGTLGQLQVTGVSTFTNGPILVGAATSTGTASQPLQVTGGAYVSGSVGVGTTNPAEILHVLGNIRMNSVPGTNTNADLPVLFQTSAGTIDGGSSLTFNPGGDVLSVNGAAISSQQFRGSGSFVTLTTTNGSSTAQYEATNTTLTLKTGSTSRVFVASGGNVGIGTDNPTYKLHVNGSFGATTKSFIIDHPTKEGKKLQYGSLEGPENGVYIRGRTQEATIELPEYWTKLVDAESITVSLTPIGNSAMPRVEKVSDNTVYVFSKEEGEMDYYYTIFAERCDVAKLEVEF